jgi:non-canonical purine NTP pyrophosphatase (RdgB/HAM1 family)
MTVYTFVTQSFNKVAETERILNMKLEHNDLALPEIQAIEVEEVVRYKVKYAYEALGRRPVMVEDTGLFIEAWNGLPGALIKWFVQSTGDIGLCKMMQGFPLRNAVAKTIVATCDEEIHIFKGEIQGQIGLVPRGSGGFGWDSVFIPNGANRTFAEMSPGEKDYYSMRRIALEAMLTQSS